MRRCAGTLGEGSSASTSGALPTKDADSVDLTPNEIEPNRHFAKATRFSEETTSDARPAASNPRTGPAHGKAYASATATATSAMNAMASSMQSDAPPCDSCGSITVRSGTCYKCLNCGASMGCS